MQIKKKHFIGHVGVAIAVILFFAIFIIQAEDATTQPTYLYYFETVDVVVESTEAVVREFEFTAFKDEEVTIVVYGLDERVIPQLILRNSDDNIIQYGRSSNGQSFAQSIEFTAPRNDNYVFEVTMTGVDADKGIARVILVEGDPLKDDITYLDTVNPLLPGRVFMVAGSDEVDEDVPENRVADTTAPIEGIRVGAEVLPVDRFNTIKPDIFVARGTTEDLPPMSERLDPDTSHIWFNDDGEKIYFFTVYAIPEELTPATKDVEFAEQNLNLLTFFYYDYLFVVGIGSDPVLFSAGIQPCSSTALEDREDCIRNDDFFRQDAATVSEDAGGEEEEVIIFVGEPTALECIGGAGLYIPVTTVGVVYGGSDCGDYMYSTYPTAGGVPQRTVVIDGETYTLSFIYFGLGGDDYIYGSRGNDYLNGGDGNDWFSFDPYVADPANITYGTDYIFGGGGSDWLDFYYLEAGLSTSPGMTITLGESGTYTIYNSTGDVIGDGTYTSIENLYGTNFDDDFEGDDNVNTIYGSDGDDTIDGGNNTDYLYGGNGNDTVYGGGDNSYDYIDGGYGSDSLYGGGGGDVIYAGWDYANNFVDAGSGNDLVYGGYGNDTINGSSGVDTVYGYSGNDTIDGGIGTDYLYGQDGNDVIYGGGDNSYDYIDGGYGVDSLYGEGGNDVIYAGWDYSRNYVDGGAGIDTIYGGYGNDTIDGGNDADYLYGYDGNDTIYGGNGNDTIYSGYGNDTVYADGGNDLLMGDWGTDALYGGSGYDTYRSYYGQSYYIYDCTIIICGDISGAYGHNTYQTDHFRTIEFIDAADYSTDYFYISGSYVDNGIVTINGGYGNDYYYFNWNNVYTAGSFYVDSSSYFYYYVSGYGYSTGYLSGNQLYYYNPLLGYYVFSDIYIYINYSLALGVDPTSTALVSGASSFDTSALSLDYSVNTIASALDTSTTGETDTTRDSTLVNAYPENETIADDISLTSTAFDDLSTANFEPLNPPETESDTSAEEETTTTVPTVPTAEPPADDPTKSGD